MQYFETFKIFRGRREKSPRLRDRLRADGFTDRSRIVNDVLAVFEKFLRNFGESFCVAGAVFVDVGG